MNILTNITSIISTNIPSFNIKINYASKSMSRICVINLISWTFNFKMFNYYHNYNKYVINVIINGIPI